MSEDKKPTTPKKSYIEVRSCWLTPVNGKVLIHCGNDYRVVSENDWGRATRYELDEDVFKRFQKPESYVREPDLQQNLWRAGALSKSQINLEIVKRATYLTNYSVNDVLERLKDE